MKTIKFKLPKTLHNGDTFKQELKLDKSEIWYGFNKNIDVASNNEYAKINEIVVFAFYLGSESSPSLLTIPISFLLNNERIFGGKNNKFLNSLQSYYDLSVIDINGNKILLRVHEQERTIFKLFINFKNKKYIKFKKEPIIFINIFNQVFNEK